MGLASIMQEIVAYKILLEHFGRLYFIENVSLFEIIQSLECTKIIDKEWLQMKYCIFYNGYKNLLVKIWQQLQFTKHKCYTKCQEISVKMAQHSDI